MKNALLPRIKALAARAQAAHKAMDDSCCDINSRIDWAKKDTEECEMMAEMTALDAAAGSGLAVGRHLSFGVGDGGADYIITKILKNVVEVEWVPLGDGYFSEAVALTLDKTKWVVLRGTAERQCHFTNPPHKRMNKKDIEIISNLLKKKFWFGGEAIYPWEHPCNYVKDAMLIRLDGCCAYKFKVHANGKLRCMKIYSRGFLDLKLKPLQTITVQELWKRIAGRENNLAGAYLQLTSPVPIPVDVKSLRELEMNRKRALAMK